MDERFLAKDEKELLTGGAPGSSPQLPTAAQSSLPLVSIITVTFNLLQAQRRASFLKMLASIAKQDYKNIEHIIIDGASRDGTLELIKDLTQQGKISSWLSEPDDGIYAAMNKGIKRAHGKYLNFMNSDDYFVAPQAISSSVEALESSPACFSFANHLSAELDGSPAAHNLAKEQILYWRAPNYKILFHMSFCHQTMFFQRDILIKLGSFNPAYKILADLDLVNTLIKNGFSGVYVPQYVACFSCGGFFTHDEELLKAEFYKFYQENLASYKISISAPKIRQIYRYYQRNLLALVVPTSYILRISKQLASCGYPHTYNMLSAFLGHKLYLLAKYTVKLLLPYGIFLLVKKLGNNADK